jgi:hypothetical protein
VKDASGRKDIDDLIPKTEVGLISKWNHNAGQYFMWTIGGMFPAFRGNDDIIRECGLCAIDKLRQIGINSLKLVTRGKTLKAKLVQVGIVKKALSEAYNIKDCKALRDSAEICDLGYLCYYPEARAD